MTVFTAKEVADKLKMTHNTVLRLMRNGTIKAVKFGSIWRVTEEELQRVLTTK